LVAAGFVCGIAFLSRSAGVALLAAFTVYLLLNRPRDALMAGVCAVALPVLWTIVSTSATNSEPYLAMLWRDWGDTSDEGALSTKVAGAAALLWVNVSAIWAGWLRFISLSPAPGIAAQCLGAVLLAPIVWGVLARLRHRHFDALYVCAYLAMIALWPHPAHAQRFLLPIVPLLFMQGLIVLCPAGTAATRASDQHSDRPPRWFLPGLYLCVIGLALIPGLVHTTNRLLNPPPEAARAFAHTRYWLRDTETQAAIADVTTRQHTIAALKKLSERLPRDACVYANHPQLVMLYAGVVSVPPYGNRAAGCQFHYVMRNPNFDAELAAALRNGAASMARYLEDGSPIGVLVHLRPN
ncbi:MAG: hypothetical protein K0U93_16410, partial [Gammaproteobacteria bacterium]|nr:hypothetical protein [Gammaproteobacteria bacterium]